MKTLGKVQRTARGFEFIKFKDRYGEGCSLQASSLADYTEPGSSAVWLGLDTPEKVERMHLDRNQVKALVRHLTAWLERNTFKCAR